MFEQYWEDAAFAQKLAVETNALISQGGFAPTPANYETCFFYVLGQNRELRAAVDDIIHAGKAHEASTSRELHRRFFGGDEPSDVSEAGSALERELKKLAQSLSATNIGSSAYSRTLNEATLKLLRSDAPRPLRELIESVAAATQVMAENSRRLETQVESSGKELEVLQAKLAAVRKESLQDALTGLANRRSFDEQIGSAVAEARSSGAPLCVLMCDIDHFKKFNDTWGHATGDQVLRLVANCVASNVKGRDTAARYGGEELVVILPHTALADAVTVAEQIRKSVESRKIVKKSTGESYGTITLSIGVAELVSGDAVESLLVRADACLYGAKREGRNRVTSVTTGEQDSPLEGSPLYQQTQRPVAASTGSMMELEFHDQHTELFVDPEVVLIDGRLKKLHAWWLSAAKEGIPVWTQTLLSDPAVACDIIHLHKVLDDGDRFEVLYVSPGLTKLLGQDVTGLVISSTPTTITAIAPTVSRAYEIAKLTFKLQSPMRTFSKAAHVLPKGRYRGESLCLPMSDAGSDIDKILIATAFIPIM